MSSKLETPEDFGRRCEWEHSRSLALANRIRARDQQVREALLAEMTQAQAANPVLKEQGVLAWLETFADKLSGKRQIACYVTGSFVQHIKSMVGNRQCDCKMAREDPANWRGFDELFGAMVRAAVTPEGDG